jgi:hypothetical protein
MPTTKAAKVREARAIYNEADKHYHKVGKKTFGSPKNAPIRREYKEAKRIRNIAGKQLAKLTNKAPRKGRR